MAIDLDLEALYERSSELADVAAGPPFAAWRLRVLGHSAFRALGRSERLSALQLAYLAGWALLAPTTHNTVPQRFGIHEDEGALAFLIDPRSVLAESDPVGRQASVSLGCVVENALLAAATFGYAGEIALEGSAEGLLRAAEPGARPLVHVAMVRFRRAPEAIEGGWLEAMRRRKMVRADYDERVKLPTTLADELRARVARVHPGLTLHVLSDAPTQLALGKFQELADSTVINRERFARELAAWLLPNDSEAPVGMRGREFGLSDAVAARIHRGLRGDERLLPDETAGFARTAGRGMRTASAVMVITAAEDDLAHRFAAGRAVEQVALRLAQEGYALAMHAGITEVEAASMALRGRLRTLRRPTVVFRVGKPLRAEDGARPRSSRPALSDVIVR